MFIVNQVIRDGKKVDVAVQFFHDINGETELHRRNETVKRASTTCKILTVPTGTKFSRDNGEVIAEGVAYVHPNDKLNKATGRRISLEKALVNENRELRTALWNAVVSKCKM